MRHFAGFIATLTVSTGLASTNALQRTEAVQSGLYRCHQAAQVMVKSIAPDQSSIVIQFKGKDYLLFAIDTDTGALRYQDPRSGITWIKIPLKSMLLDSRLGRQLANDCRL